MLKNERVMTNALAFPAVSTVGNIDAIYEQQSLSDALDRNTAGKARNRRCGGGASTRSVISASSSRSAAAIWATATACRPDPEGNIGLMKAVKRYDPARGVRLVSFCDALDQAEIHEYILKNWRLVKVATTKAQRKLFFNLRSLKNDLRRRRYAVRHAGGRKSRLAGPRRSRSRKEVVEMETRLTGRDLALEGSRTTATRPLPRSTTLADSRYEPTHAGE